MAVVMRRVEGGDDGVAAAVVAYGGGGGSGMVTAGWSGAWDGDGGSGVMMVVELWWAAMGRQPEERATRGGEWIWGSGRSVEDLSFYIFWVRRSLAGKVAGGVGGGRNNSPEKMEEEDDVCVCYIFVEMI
ncbi:hypothetical protein Tco_1572452 [Tanacetum coccineum]